MSPRYPVYLFSISFKKIIIRQKPFFVIIFVSLSYFFFRYCIIFRIYFLTKQYVQPAECPDAPHSRGAGVARHSVVVSTPREGLLHSRGRCELQGRRQRTHTGILLKLYVYSTYFIRSKFSLQFLVFRSLSLFRINTLFHHVYYYLAETLFHLYNYVS